jgi:hypothetical protein
MLFFRNLKQEKALPIALIKKNILKYFLKKAMFQLIIMQPKEVFEASRNWHLIDTVNGAKTSAIIYSIAETAIPKHMEDINLDFLDDLLPWSEKLPLECKKIK